MPWLEAVTKAEPSERDAALFALVQPIAAGDAAAALKVLAVSPQLARTALRDGDTRGKPPRGYHDGDTALHLAASAHDVKVIQALIAAGADVRARNRRGAEPLHNAAMGAPGAASWNPAAQGEAVALLLRAGADPNAPDSGGATALHKAVRTRSAVAVEALLAAVANPRLKTGGGSDARTLAGLTTGRSGTGSDEAKAEQLRIFALLKP